jgi:hypothetical protein
VVSVTDPSGRILDFLDLTFLYITYINTIDVSLPLPKDGNRPSLRNYVFSSYLEFRKMDKVDKPSDSENDSLLM